MSIGIDIGGTKMAVGLADPFGLILHREVLATEAEQGFDRAVRRLGDAVEGLLARIGQGKLRAIGIGCAGPIDPALGLINNPFTLTGWDRCNITAPLSKRFNVPVWLENDADAAALGECASGAGRGFDPVVMLTFGTGVGGGAIVEGRIYRGVQGQHPELGHVPVASGGAPCYCGISGCLESIASGTAIGEAGGRAAYPDARAVFAGADRGEASAGAIVNRALDAAAIAAWILCHTFLPQRLILGGGMMQHHFELFAAAMRQKLQGATQFTPASVSIARAELGNDAGMVGAASMALRRALETTSPMPKYH